MIRELATKTLASPSRNHRHIDTNILSKGISRKRETHPSSKNVDALKPTFEEEDSEIEISGPFPLSFKPESTKIVSRTGLKPAVQQANAKPIHPFFSLHIPHAPSNGPHLSLRAASSVSATQLRLEPIPLNVIATNQNAASGKLDPMDTFLTSKNSVPGAQINTQFPIYSYKRYKPLPTVVYTQHEEETNDLIAGLKPGPLAFDMEWRFYFVDRGLEFSKRKVERRTAVVQVADANGFILVIQIYKMKRFPIALQSLLENPDIPKLGVNILNDGKKLFRDYGILAQNLVELGALALLADPAGSKERSTSKRKIISLVKLVQWYCGMEVEKGDERVSNWELNLSKRQIDYAANDVHSSMEVYQKLCDIAQLNDISLADNKSAFTTEVTLPSTEKYPSWSPIPSGGGIKAPGQSIRAYHFWHHNEMTLDNMCKELSLRKKEGGLKPATVITYIITALKTDPSLPYSMPKLIKLVQMDVESWTCHREWVVYVWNQNLVAE